MSYSKIPAGKPLEPNHRDKRWEKPFITLKTREEKSARIVSSLEKLSSDWLPFVKKVTQDPEIPLPELICNNCLTVVPTSFKWRKGKEEVLAVFSDPFEWIEVDIGQGYKIMTAEEAYKAVRAVFVPAKAK